MRIQRIRREATEDTEGGHRRYRERIPKTQRIQREATGDTDRGCRGYSERIQRIQIEDTERGYREYR